MPKKKKTEQKQEAEQEETVSAIEERLKNIEKETFAKIEAIASTLDELKPMKDLVNRHGTILKEIDQYLDNLKEHLITTRETAVLQNLSLPALSFQFRKTLAENQGLNDYAKEIGISLDQTQISFQQAMRLYSRERERSELYRQAIDDLLKKNSSLEKKVGELEHKIERQQITIESQQNVIDGYKELQKLAAKLVEASETPPDVIARIEQLLPKLPSEKES